MMLGTLIGPAYDNLADELVSAVSQTDLTSLKVIHIGSGLSHRSI